MFAPILTVDETAICWVLQKMPDLLASTESSDVKQEELQKLADKVSASMVEKESLAKDQLRAVLHVLELCEFAVDKPSVQLDAVTPEHETRETYDSRPFIADTRTGIARWVSVSEEDKYKRIILSPDEGGPLYTAWQFCAKNQLPIGFCRDELQLARSLSIQKALGQQPTACTFLRRDIRLAMQDEETNRVNLPSWNFVVLQAHADDLLQQLYAELILAENDIPFTDDAQQNFQHVLEILNNVYKHPG
ncbi:hemA [Symbiodinium natans]|uniref:HemA protein n=1 Tax=Symbiodinium natans TaxID=878477 RepID=A0A812MEX4_9DINO|nr:hemA [Symbiodinium natans]